MTNVLGNYYQRRRDDELAAADRATNREAAAIHRALAARYAALAGQSQTLAHPLDQDGKIAAAEAAAQPGADGGQSRA